MDLKGLRIAFLLDNGPGNWRSQEDFHFRLCRELVAHGALPVLVYSGKVAGAVLARMLTSGAEVVTEARLHGLAHYYRELFSIVRRFNVHVVHVRYFVCHSSIHWLARALPVRTILYTEANGWMPAPRSHTDIRRVLSRMRMRLACWPVTRFIAISQFIKNRLVLYGVHPSRISVVYNGVNLSRFAPDTNAGVAWRARYGLAPDELVISTVSRLDPVKDVETLVRAFALLVKRGLSARLFVAGTGELEADLKALSHALGVAERVRWLGHVDNPIPMLQGSDVFCLSSLGEAFGFALAEAMACELPCVGTRAGGISEVVEDGVTGLLAAPMDPSSFADALEVLARDHMLRREMGNAGADRVHRLFTLDHAVERTLSVYEELLDGIS